MDIKEAIQVIKNNRHWVNGGEGHMETHENVIKAENIIVAFVEKALCTTPILSEIEQNILEHKKQAE
jgi:hypothetical protein